MGQGWSVAVGKQDSGLMFGCRREAAAKHQTRILLSNSFRPALPRRRNSNKKGFKTENIYIYMDILFWKLLALDELGKAVPASQHEGLEF